MIVWPRIPAHDVAVLEEVVEQRASLRRSVGATGARSPLSGSVFGTGRHLILFVGCYEIVNRLLLVLLAGVLALAGSEPVLAWSDIGHLVICKIAFQELEPTTRDRV